MEKYILKISPKAYIRIEPEELIITPKIGRATPFDKIGSAMVVAAQINDDFEAHVVRVIRLQEST